ncbi:circadian clock KaiB family protein [Streptosporangium sp. NBC_01755]|uniref:circadian clock KaiB family protein n=1 Tax=Streptosporangium sp. NBC_01755 TaxID=2975949 RepID=UPI002DDBDE5E|nr:circadian clock KaiB family protein [Streptosporangium sp. NBC_01755]WSD01941.1 circadian clock KaiB family protein [Streptosporangium sp. NBC_01755]
MPRPLLTPERARAAAYPAGPVWDPRRLETSSQVTIYSFRLYVAGNTERSKAAEVNLRFLCDARLSGTYEVEVVDAAERPDLAEEGRILATPTVIRLAPSPQLRVIGDLSDHNRAAVALGLPVLEEPPPERPRR